MTVATMLQLQSCDDASSNSSDVEGYHTIVARSLALWIVCVHTAEWREEATRRGGTKRESVRMSPTFA
jgi:hypothetical protein